MSDEVARWQSKGGKYTLSLFRDDTGFFYRGTDCGGYLGPMDTLTAIADIERRLPDFQADANKTPMRRVYPPEDGQEGSMTSNAQARTCDGCGGSGWTSVPRDGNDQGCLVCDGTGVVTDCAPVADALADAETLRRNLSLNATGEQYDVAYNVYMAGSNGEGAREAMGVALAFARLGDGSVWLVAVWVVAALAWAAGLVGREGRYPWEKD